MVSELRGAVSQLKDAMSAEARSFKKDAEESNREIRRLERLQRELRKALAVRESHLKVEQSTIESTQERAEDDRTVPTEECPRLSAFERSPFGPFCVRAVATLPPALSVTSRAAKIQTNRTQPPRRPRANRPRSMQP